MELNCIRLPTLQIHSSLPSRSHPLVTVQRPKIDFMLIQVDVKPMFLDMIIADGQVIVDSVSPSIVGIKRRRGTQPAASGAAAQAGPAARIELNLNRNTALGFSYSGMHR